jgi:predicted ATP-grasp superfamily ATP-dependent carboligase
MIFDNLKYSGFACIDFTIKNSNIIIFEINPRPGGSLIYNKKYFDKFIDTIILHV